VLAGGVAAPWSAGLRGSDKAGGGGLVPDGGGGRVVLQLVGKPFGGGGGLNVPVGATLGAGDCRSGAESGLFSPI
jgi:hypothetical protein